MRLKDAEVDIMFISKGNNIEYINKQSNHLFDGHKLDGRVAKITYTSQIDHSDVDVFVAFDDQDSYTMFTMQVGIEQRLNYVINAVYQEIVMDYLSPASGYDTKYEYTYKLFKEDYGFLMVNASATKAYQVNESKMLVKSSKTWEPGTW
ncbi:MAG: hypothetical protein ISR69_14825 [Gammaproteobacteria bacterium]|nr:hypothetical protein [Gammaproteobacteria bacterium]